MDPAVSPNPAFLYETSAQAGIPQPFLNKRFYHEAGYIYLKVGFG
jgi:hypothetical protein